MRATRLLSTLVAAAAALASTACGGSSTPPPAPHMVAASPLSQSANQGTAVPTAPAVQVLDASNNPVAGVAVTFVITGGGGSITGPSTTTGANGVAAAGSWVMGPPGPQTLVAQATSVTGSPLAFSATSIAVVPPEAASIEAASLTPQAAQAGHGVGDPPAVLVRSATGQPVPGTPVAFQVVSGGGTLTGAAATSGADGVARVARWTLGASGVQQVQAAVSGLAGSPVTFDATIRTTTFDIKLNFVTSATVSQRLAFQRARERIEEVVVGDLPDVPLSLSGAALAQCGGVAVQETVDDLLIQVILVPIDGPGNVLGQATPCIVRTSDGLPVIGMMQFDTADVDRLESRGQLEEVVLHEMLHVVGFGILWDSVSPAVLIGAGTADPIFTGAQAMDAFLNYNNGAFYTGAKIPLENSGLPGTRDSHWRESILKNELMTGYLSGATQPLSRTTIGSLADLGYQVDLLAADPYDLSTAANLRLATAAAEPAPLEMVDDVIRVPLMTVDPDGTVRPRVP